MATYRKELADLRDLLWDKIRETTDGNVAPIAKQLADVLTKIHGLDVIQPAEGSKTDELRARRDARRAKAANQEST